MEYLFSSFTVAFGVTMALVGFSAQVVKNYREQRCGMNLPLLLLGNGLYVSRISYSVVIHRHALVVPDAIGLVLLGIVLAQYFLYHSSPKPVEG